MADGAAERRRYFRVTDLVGLNYRFLSEGERDLAMAAQPTSLKSLLSRIDEQITSSLLSLKNSHPELHKLMDLYNQKINLAFGHGLANADEDYSQSMQACHVNLSACGIAFPSRESVQLNQYVTLDMTLYPSNLRLQLLGAVIACESVENAEDGNSYWIRADFVSISDADQELLVQHVIKRQAQQLKESRESSERTSPEN